MKKVLLAASAVALSISAYSQVYVGVNAGYGFASPKDIVGSERVLGVSEKNVYGTLGQGLNLGVTPGFWLGDHVGAELGINYFMGSKIEAGSVSSPLGKTTVTAWSNQLRLIPAVVLKTGGENLGLYTRFGLVIPAGGKTISETEGTALGPKVFEREETVGQASLGYTGALGFDFGIGEGVKFFAEASMMNLRISANKSTITESTVDGADALGQMTTYEKEKNYVDEINSGSNQGQNQGQAADVLRINRNYSAIFLNIGIRFTF